MMDDINTPELKDIIVINHSIINNLKIQKVRLDMSFDKYKNSVDAEALRPSNRFLDWTKIVVPYQEMVTNTKVTDFELIKAYENYVNQLIKYNRMFVIRKQDLEEKDSIIADIIKTVISLEKSIKLLREEKIVLEKELVNKSVLNIEKPVVPVNIPKPVVNPPVSEPEPEPEIETSVPEIIPEPIIVPEPKKIDSRNAELMQEIKRIKFERDNESDPNKKKNLGNLIWVKKRKIEGMCIQCSNKAKENRTLCESCLKSKNKEGIEYYKRKKKRGDKK